MDVETDISDGRWINSIAHYFGASEAAFKLLISVLAGYLLALLHRQFLYGKEPFIQHMYFILCGISLGYFNYGSAVIHSAICIVSTYALLLFVGGTALSVGISFVFLMLYLLLAYYSTGTEDYDITWSMPHCVLTLRLLGLTMDVYDGKKKVETLTADQKKTALPKMPGLFEITAHCYFFGGFLVGPQFPLKRYLDFVHGAFSDKNGGKPSCVVPAVSRFLLGMAYLTIYQVGSYFLAERYLLTDEYNALPFMKRALILGVWGKISLYKYVACWLLSEGTCIMIGLTYNNKDENGNDLWDGCANVKIWKYETGVSFDSAIKSFNVNTNLWASQYIFKRLKFLGNKLLSQFLTLLFLAVWHGLHSGYYMTFLMEFVVMKMERDVLVVIQRMPALYNLLSQGVLRVPVLVFCKIWQVVMFGYCIAPFVLLSLSKWWQVYKSVYFMGYVIYFGWPLILPLLKNIIPRDSTKGRGNGKSH